MFHCQWTHSQCSNYKHMLIDVLYVVNTHQQSYHWYYQLSIKLWNIPLDFINTLLARYTLYAFHYVNTYLQQIWNVSPTTYITDHCIHSMLRSFPCCVNNAHSQWLTEYPRVVWTVVLACGLFLSSEWHRAQHSNDIFHIPTIWIS